MDIRSNFETAQPRPGTFAFNRKGSTINEKDENVDRRESLAKPRMERLEKNVEADILHNGIKELPEHENMETSQ